MDRRKDNAIDTETFRTLRRSKNGGMEPGVDVLKTFASLPLLRGQPSARVPPKPPAASQVKLPRGCRSLSARQPDRGHAVPGLVSRLAETFPTPETLATTVPPRYHVFRTALDVNRDDAKVAVYDFHAPMSARQASSIARDHSLTFKIPTLPSPTHRVGSTSGDQRSVVTMRHEVHYLAQVADSMSQENGAELGVTPAEAALAQSKQKDIARIAQPATVGLRRTAFLLHEVARMVSPICLDLANLMLKLEESLLELPTKLCSALQASSDEVAHVTASLDDSEAARSTLARSIDELRRSVAALEAQAATEPQQFAAEVEAKGLRPELKASAAKEPPVAPQLFSAEQLNSLPSDPPRLYAFSPERVVPGKLFSKRPVVSVDVGVDCTDLYYEMQTKGSSRGSHRTPLLPSTQGETPANEPALRKVVLQFKGAAAVPQSHKPLSLLEVFKRLKSSGVLPGATGEEDTTDSQEGAASNPLSLSVPTAAHDVASPLGESSDKPGSSRLKRRSSMMFRRKNSAFTSDKSPPPSPSMRVPESPSGLVPRRGRRASAVGPGGLGVKADESTQTEGQESASGVLTVDACVQAVEVDIDRKMRRSRRSASGSATPLHPSSQGGREPGRTRGTVASSRESTSRRPSRIGQELLAAEPVWPTGEELDDPEAIVPVIETASVACNTDVNLTGLDVTRLEFEDAIKVRFPDLFREEDTDDGTSGVNDTAGDPSVRSSTSNRKSSKKPKRASKNEAQQLPTAIADVFGFPDTSAARVRSAVWVNGSLLEILKHVEPFKLATSGKSLAELTMAHFRAKYGLDKMAVGYAIDFVGNLKLHSHSSVRAFLYVSWCDLWGFAGFDTPPGYCTNEALCFYLFAFQAVVRTCSHRQLKELDGSKMVASWPLMEHVLEFILRDVASSYNDASEWEQDRIGWMATLLSADGLTDDARARVDSAHDSVDTVGRLPKVDSLGHVLESLRLNSDVFLLVLTCNYSKLRQRLQQRAEHLHKCAVERDAASSKEQFVVDGNGKCFQVQVPSAEEIMGRLASWPLLTSASDAP